MLIALLSLAMIATLTVATVATMRSDDDRNRVKVKANRTYR